MIAELVPRAREELAKKSQQQIDLETAAMWAARAVAAYETYHGTGDVRWYGVAMEYKHEALEHAAGGPPGSLEKIRTELHSLIARYT